MFRFDCANGVDSIFKGEFGVCFLLLFILHKCWVVGWRRRVHHSGLLWRVVDPNGGVGVVLYFEG